MENIGNKLFEIVTKGCNDEINRNKDFVHYLKSMNKKHLAALRVLYAYGSNDNDFLKYGLEDIMEDDKEYIIEDVLETFDSKLALLVQFFKEDLMDDLLIIADSEGDLYEFDPKEDNEISILTIGIARVLGFIFCKKTKTGSVLIHMPKHVGDKITELFNCVYFEYYGAVFEYTRGIMETYGAMRIEEVYDIIKDYILISLERYENMIRFVTITKVDLLEYEFDGGILYNARLTQKQAKELVNSNKLKNIYSKEMYQSIASREYFLGIEPYKHLIEYLEDNYDIDLIDEEMISHLGNFIAEYVNNAQVNSDKAKANLYCQLDMLFECNKHQKDDIIVYFEEIRKRMPSWKHGGKIVEERQTKKVGRNTLCPCGSGKKYKECHGKNPK